MKHINKSYQTIDNTNQKYWSPNFCYLIYLCSKHNYFSYETYHINKNVLILYNNHIKVI